MQNFSEAEAGSVRCRLCSAQNVNGMLAANHVGNLKRHVSLKHPDQALQCGLSPLKQTVEISGKFQGIKNTNSYLKNIVKMVTVGSLSFRSLDSPGLSDIIGVMNGMFGVTVTSRNVHKFVKAAGAAMRRRIISVLQGRMICYKMDAATCHGRSLLGTTAQFADDGEIRIRVLGCIEVNESHTADMLATETKDLMEQFGQNIDNAYAITVDNAANMKRTVKKLSEEQANDYDDFGFDELLEPMR